MISSSPSNSCKFTSITSLSCPTIKIQMSILPLKIGLSLKGHWHEKYPSENPISTPNLGGSWTFLGLPRRGATSNICIKTAATSKHDSFLTVPELERDNRREYYDDEALRTEEPKRILAENWKEIHGKDDWNGMLDPIDALLRSELIRYGDMAQACYDTFDLDPYSKYCGSCKIKPSEFFQYPGSSQYGYEVTRYFYATHNTSFPNFFVKSLCPERWSPTANWIGYISVSNDETSAYLGRRDITIAWRGAVTRTEWTSDFTHVLKPVTNRKIPSRDPIIKVDDRFLHVYTEKDNSCAFTKYSVREQVLAEVKRLIKQYADEELSITITCHGLGSGLAILNAYDIAETGVDVMEDGRVVPIAVFSFSGPRVGNSRFKERLEGLGVKVLRVVNVHDKVPIKPWFYSHIGVELALDHKQSPFLKEKGDQSCFHNLEVHLHLLDGYHGKGRKFMLTSRRDFALVNKACDFLEDHFLVPPNWWQTKNRGLVRNPSGHWMQPERHDLEHHLQLEDVPHHLQQLSLPCD